MLWRTFPWTLNLRAARRCDRPAAIGWWSRSTIWRTGFGDAFRIGVNAVSMRTVVDWEMLRAKATEVAQSAYAPYSRLRVGAAGLAGDGRVFVGCNVENVSYGLALCAECGVVSALRAGGADRLVALACADAAGGVLMPCGRCRQVLGEHGGAELLIDHPDGPRRLADLLPDAFGPESLP